MTYSTQPIIQRAIKPKNKERLDILCFDTHERCQSQMAKTGHNFYGFRYKDCKVWNTNFAEIPSNYHPIENLYDDIDFDFILSQSKFGQLQISKQIQQQLGLPIIHLEHTIPTSNYTPEQVEMFKSIWGDYNIFISEYARESWGFDESETVICNSIDHEFFKPMDVESDETVFTVQNDFINRDYCLNYQGWQRIINGFSAKVLGETEGLSKAADSLEHLREEYNKCAVYINTTTESQMPTAILEAMACGKPVVSTATCSIPSFIKHGENGFLTNDEEEFRGYVQQLLDDKDLRDKIGQSARETVLDVFSEQKYIDSWNKVFKNVYEDLK
jgi:glycosyltransferase involved in cell wall biosynthesis